MPRLMIWSAVSVLIVCALSLNRDIEQYVSNLSNQVEFDRETWLIAERFSDETLTIASFAGMDRKSNYPDTLCDVFVPQQTRLQIGLQSSQDFGVTNNSTSAEFASLVFGCHFKAKLQKMSDAGELSRERTERLILDCSELSKGQKFWNCSAACVH
tara:strand:- start:290 stop:757 length:468 start_codon:yes stop_codon:yes gene_type:complete